MRLHHGCIVLSLVAAPSTCTAAQDKSPNAKPVHEPAPSEVTDPLARFARMVGGEWRVTFQSGTSAFDSWHWGPGKYSMRNGTGGSDAVGNPWGGEVMYWHPGRKQVCLLSLHGDIPGVGRGVSEGTITFEGETADGVFDLYQPGGRREMGLRWIFDGPDRYHSILLEATGPDGLEPMNEWDFVRVKERSATRRSTTEEAPIPSEHLKAFQALLGCTWEARGDSATGDAFCIQSTFEWVPSEAIHARTLALGRDGEPAHLLDMYLYQHVGTGALRCLALSNRGGVHEGDLTVLEGGALQVVLKGYEGHGVVPHVVRIDFEGDETLRYRDWSLEGSERTLILDLHHKKLEPKKD